MGSITVPFPHGFPLDRPADPPRQLAVLEAALRVLEDVAARPPVLADYTTEAELARLL